MRADRTRRMQQSQATFDAAMKEPFETRPLPWTARQVIHDGPGWQFFDGNDRPVLTQLLREPEDTAWLLRFVNTFETDDRFLRYHTLKQLVLVGRRLEAALSEGKETNQLIQEFSKVLETYGDDWKDETNG